MTSIQTEKTEPRISATGDQKTNVSGDADVTLIGTEQAVTYNDAVGFESAGKLVHRNFDYVPDDVALLPALRPSIEVEHSIESILSRPVKIDTVTFKSSTLIGGLMREEIDIITELRTKPYFQLAREKLSSFYGFNCTAHLRITLNPQPFEAGLFQIYFIPFHRFSKIVPDNISNQECRIPFSTGCPNVLCNISLQSDVDLSIPYTGPVPFINLTNTNADFGAFFLQCIAPISDSTNNASCELSVYMYFTDVKLFGATALTWPVNPEQMKLQGVISQVSNAQQPPSEESWFKKLRSFLQDSVSSGTSSLLDMLGLSKPTQDQVVSRVIVNPYSLQPTGSGNTGAIKYSLDADQQLAVTQLGIDKFDELDINYFVSKPTYVGQFKWNVGQEAGTLLDTYIADPNCYLITMQGAPGAQPSRMLAPSRLRYMANVFSYWRGTNRFRIIVVGTKFHSGRLRLVYSLGGKLTNFHDYPRTFSQIIDLRDGMVFEVECPYFASAPWRCVPQVLDINPENIVSKPCLLEGYQEEASFKDEVNLLQIFVENELRASSTVANEISLVVLQSGGDDFQFAGPRGSIFAPSFREGDAEERMELQGVGDLDVKRINMCSAVDALPQQEEPESLTFGEKVRSVREMIKRYQFQGTFTDGKVVEANKNYALFPYYNAIRRSNKDMVFDWIAYFWPVYRFYRGGTRYQFLTYDRDLTIICRFEPDLKAYFYWMGEFENAGPPNMGFTHFSWRDRGFNPIELGLEETPVSSTTMCNFNLQGGQELEIPYYHRLHKCVTVMPTQTEQMVKFALSEVYPPSIVLMTLSGKITEGLQVFKSVADDFNFGYLLGAPLTTDGMSLFQSRV